MHKRYTIEEFKKYLKLNKNLSDVYSHLNEKNIDKAINGENELTQPENFYL